MCSTGQNTVFTHLNAFILGPYVCKGGIITALNLQKCHKTDPKSELTELIRVVSHFHLVVFTLPFMLACVNHIFWLYRRDLNKYAPWL